MRHFAPGCVALAVAVTASWAAPAQTPADPAAIVQSQENRSAELAVAWLGSSDARVRAWGAYLAQRDHRRELLPGLIGSAEEYPVKPGLLGACRDEKADAGLLRLEMSLGAAGDASFPLAVLTQRLATVVHSGFAGR
jgi:hypothetical protein